MSTRKPTTNQQAVLQAIVTLQTADGTNEPIAYNLDRIWGATPHLMFDRTQLLTTVLAIAKHDWLKTSITAPRQTKERGDNLAWSLTKAGVEAFARAQGSSDDQKEDVMSPTETQDPPASAPAWGKAPEEPVIGSGQAPADDADLQALDADGDDHTEDGGETEVQEPDAETPTKETHVVEGTNQLTMLVVPKGSRLKPKQFTLSIRGRQQEFGTTREYLAGERIEFHGVLEVDEMRTKRKKDGTWVKVALAKVAECDLLDAPVAE